MTPPADLLHLLSFCVPMQHLFHLLALVSGAPGDGPSPEVTFAAAALALDRAASLYVLR